MENNSLTKRDQDKLEAGTGFMESLSDCIRRYENKGYVKNLTPKYDHFECDCGECKLYPQDFNVDVMQRFDNASDPGDQAVMYAISSKDGKIKGIYVDSYGTYHDSLHREMVDRLKDHVHKKTINYRYLSI